MNNQKETSSRRFLRIYPTPEAMREAADRLANDRHDQLTSDIVQLMRWLADAMESGKLRER